MDRMTVAIEWKALGSTPHPFELKADENDGNTLIGYASTFGNVDLGGDVVVKGAFDKSINRIKAEGIPLLADHIASTASLLGTINDAATDDHGLIIKARISMAPSAQDTAVKLREGHLSKLSIGYQSMDDALEERDGRTVRLLKEIKLWETSVVVFPMNPEAAVSGMKAMAVEYLSEAERLTLADRLAEAESNGLEHSTVDPKNLSTQAGSSELKTQAGSQAPVAPRDDSPNAGDEPPSASDEGATGYDKWASRAVLAGRPIEDVDPVKRAELLTRLRLAESQLPPDTETE